MAGSQSASKTNPATAPAAPAGTWLDELDLSKQTLTLYIQGGGRIRGPSGNTVNSVSIGPGSVGSWSGATVGYCPVTGMFLIKKDGVIIRTVAAYAAEVV